MAPPVPVTILNPGLITLSHTHLMPAHRPCMTVLPAVRRHEPAPLVKKSVNRVPIPSKNGLITLSHGHFRPVHRPPMIFLPMSTSQPTASAPQFLMSSPRRVKNPT